MLLIGLFEGNTREWLAYLLVVVFIKVSLWLDSSLVWCIFLYHYGHHEPEQKKVRVNILDIGCVFTLISKRLNRLYWDIRRPPRALFCGWLVSWWVTGPGSVMEAYQVLQEEDWDDGVNSYLFFHACKFEFNRLLLSLLDLM